MDATNKTKVLITGGVGFLGRNLYSHLTSKGFDVISMVHKNRVRGQKIIFGDVLEQKSLKKAMNHVDFVVHCAAKMGHANKHELFKVNYEGTKNMIDVAISSGVSKFIHISTLAVADEYIDHFNSNENIMYPTKIRNQYTTSKIEAEKYVVSHKKDLEVIILRPGWLWGPGDSSIKDLFKMIQDRHFGFIGDGHNLTYFTHICNMVQAIELAIVSKDIQSGEIFNITDGVKLNMETFVNTIADGFHLPPVTRHVPIRVANLYAGVLERINPNSKITRQNVAILSKNLHFDISKAQKLLNYSPDKNYKGQIKGIIDTDF